MKTKKIYISPRVKVMCSDDFMEGDIDIYSVVGDEIELAKENHFDDDEVFGLQDYGNIWDE